MLDLSASALHEAPKSDAEQPSLVVWFGDVDGGGCIVSCGGSAVPGELDATSLSTASPLPSISMVIAQET